MSVVEEQIDGAIQAMILRMTSNIVDEDCPKLTPVPKRIISSYPGIGIAWDDCCDGQLTFQLQSMTPRFRAGRSMMTPCAVAWWDVVIEVTILRCTPTINDQGIAPRPRKISESGLRMYDDMNTILSAIQSRPEVVLVGNWTPSGPQGGCVGGAWTFTMRVDAEPCA